MARAFPDIQRIYNILNRRYRVRRMQQIEAALHLSSETHVLDVGGTRYLWSIASQRPRLVLVNLASPGRRQDGIRDVIADARRLPFKDDAFDVVFSNSLIDHLSTFEQQRLFAGECRRVAKRHVIQSPNHWFPIEPHLVAPFIHWLPTRIRRPLLAFTLWGLVDKPTREERDQFVEEVRMLTVKEMRMLFPESIVYRERVLGLTKSIIAIKT